jgi:hypothetical protein
MVTGPPAVSSISRSNPNTCPITCWGAKENVKKENSKIITIDG